MPLSHRPLPLTYHGTFWWWFWIEYTRPLEYIRNGSGGGVWMRFWCLFRSRGRRRRRRRREMIRRGGVKGLHIWTFTSHGIQLLISSYWSHNFCFGKTSNFGVSTIWFRTFLALMEIIPTWTMLIPLKKWWGPNPTTKLPYSTYVSWYPRLWGYFWFVRPWPQKGVGRRRRHWWRYQLNVQNFWKGRHYVPICWR